MLDHLPSELLREICHWLYLEHPASIPQLAIANRNCYAAAAFLLFHTIKIQFSGFSGLLKQVEQCQARLEREKDGYQLVRRLVITGDGFDDDGQTSVSRTGLKPSWCRLSICAPERADHDIANVDHWLDAPDNRSDDVSDEPLSAMYQSNHKWLPLARLVEKMSALSDLIFGCENQIPLCLLDVLHDQLPLCKLRMNTFRLRSLGASTLDPHEYKLITSPNLFGIRCVQEEVDRDLDDEFEDQGSSNGRFYEAEAVMGVVAGLAPNIKQVRIIYRENLLQAIPPHSLCAEANILRQGDNARLLPPFCLGSIEHLQLSSRTLASPCLPGQLIYWLEHTDFNRLRALKLNMSIPAELLTDLATKYKFPSLKTLVLRASRQEQDAIEDETRHHLESIGLFVQSIVHHGAYVLQLEDWNFDVLSPVPSLGSSLITLRLVTSSRRGTRGALSRVAVEQLVEQCPLLEDLALPIQRLKGNVDEVSIYNTLSRLRNLRHLSLLLMVIPNLLSLESSSFDKFDLQPLKDFPPYQNGHMRDAFVNSAVDEALARSIFHVITGLERTGNDQSYRSTCSMKTIRLTVAGWQNFSAMKSLILDRYFLQIGHDLDALHVLRTQPEAMTGTSLGKPDGDIEETKAALGFFLTPNDTKAYLFGAFLLSNGELIGSGFDSAKPPPLIDTENTLASQFHIVFHLSLPASVAMLLTLNHGTMEHSHFLRAADPKEVALLFVLKHGLHRVSWQDCRLVWDSHNLIEETPTRHQIAVFGVEGKVIAPDRTSLTFQIRHSLEIDCGLRYQMHASIRGKGYAENIAVEKHISQRRSSPNNRVLSHPTGVNWAHPEDIEGIRRKSADELKKYQMSLKSGAGIGDSVVRRFSVLSRKFSVVEQTISVALSMNRDIWSGEFSQMLVVWLDNARDLSESPPGPWCPEDRTRSVSNYMFPIIQHRDNLALAKGPGRPYVSSQASVGHATLWQANQNACLLPFQYGNFLDHDIMKHDALYALSDVFRLSAASENQFLNLVEDLKEHEMEVSRNKSLNQASMLNLRYLRKILDDHITRITETALLLSDWEQLQWPRAAPDSPYRAEADRTAVLVLRDFTHLKQRAERLSKACQEGIQSLANDAAFQESVKAVANARRVGRLTTLATVFVPLTFTSSIFGMNFADFGQGHLSIWVFFPVAAGIMALTYLSWYMVAPSWLARVWARFQRWGH
ncbi:hypothetical protein HJFPF1_07468 [Paramyrothecium foliicola]|nr:hypothetical protein HJFPF1_07468 [Paramyrothecium foliicola]